VTSPHLVFHKDEDGEFLLDNDGNKIKDDEASENVDLFNIKNPQMCMTVRADTRSYLGTVGVGYKVVQNTEFAEFFDAALGPDAACISAVGSLGRYGARIFMIATLPEMLEIGPGDPVEQHILLTSTHDGTGPVEARFIAWQPERNVMIHAPGGAVTIRHTKNAKKRVQTAHKVLHENEQYWARAKRAFAYMAKRDANEQRVREFLAAMYPDIPEKDEKGKPKKDEEGNVVMKTSPQAQASRDAIETVFEDAENSLPRTDWGLYNAVAIFVDHERRVAKSQRANGISRWEVSVFGAGASLRDRAYRWFTNNK